MDINTPDKFREYFLDFSVVLTGFSRLHLQGTGQVFNYFDAIEKVIGREMFEELLETFHVFKEKADFSDDKSILTSGLHSDILGSEKLGPIARNIIKLWYTATWYQLPQYWRDLFGTKEEDKTRVINPQAYPEGLLWPTIGVNPPGAKGPGYGTWSERPSVKLR